MISVGMAVLLYRDLSLLHEGTELAPCIYRQEYIPELRYIFQSKRIAIIEHLFKGSILRQNVHCFMNHEIHLTQNVSKCQIQFSPGQPE